MPNRTILMAQQLVQFGALVWPNRSTATATTIIIVAIIIITGLWSCHHCCCHWPLQLPPSLLLLLVATACSHHCHHHHFCHCHHCWPLELLLSLSLLLATAAAHWPCGTVSHSHSILVLLTEKLSLCPSLSIIYSENNCEGLSSHTQHSYVKFTMQNAV
jgi:hypothetical protein